MSHIRFEALKEAKNRPEVKVTPPANRISDYFGVNVFNQKAMQRYLSSSTYKNLNATIEKGEKIDTLLADAVASGMKAWAIENGVTHYTHWFQPLRGSSAEKHDSFFRPSFDGTPLEEFKGSTLVQQEPDASSFPSGGLRVTFEARGYTAWDPSSPAFIVESGGGKTLCIPSLFVSYTGEALDHKTPLIRSIDLLNRAATNVCRLFDRAVNKVTVTLGVEQEFFVVDKSLFYARHDLMLGGRTVLSHAPARGQQLDDHYFGSIPSRVKAFMQDFEIESLKLGIPITTRHNEVAPAQYECAPQFEEVNVAVDHNMVLMDVMSRVAERHSLKVLFHEKPFQGVNGSGKHNNWALSTDTGKNLLAPSNKPKENLQFLTFFVNTIKAVHEHADLLRASIASDSNDYRLGANEAPPAIISVFVGSQLDKVLNELEENAKVEVGKGDNMYIKLGIDKIPPILLDNTDRNRTSPFAFTGNKFEFRAVGSSANCSLPMMVLNTAVADQLTKFHAEVEKLEQEGEKRELAIVNVLRRYIKESKAIRFEGNNYSDEWAAEAKKRGLSNFRTTPEALTANITEKGKKLFIDNSILTEQEIEARQEIHLENYLRQVQIESRLIGDLTVNHVIPSAMKYLGELTETIHKMQKIGIDDDLEMIIDTARRISKHVNKAAKLVKEMINERKKANLLHTEESAEAYCNKIKPYFDKIRYEADKLEQFVDDELWQMPKYRELLFVK
jgi:glutamine synthetase